MISVVHENHLKVASRLWKYLGSRMMWRLFIENWNLFCKVFVGWLVELDMIQFLTSFATSRLRGGTSKDWLSGLLHLSNISSGPVHSPNCYITASWHRWPRMKPISAHLCIILYIKCSYPYLILCNIPRWWVRVWRPGHNQLCCNVLLLVSNLSNILWWARHDTPHTLHTAHCSEWLKMISRSVLGSRFW